MPGHHTRLFNDAEHRALIRIAERHSHGLGRNWPCLIGRYSASSEQFCYSQTNNAHAGLIEDAIKVRKTPAVRNRPQPLGGRRGTFAQSAQRGGGATYSR